MRYRCCYVKLKVDDMRYVKYVLMSTSTLPTIFGSLFHHSRFHVRLFHLIGPKVKSESNFHLTARLLKSEGICSH